MKNGIKLLAAGALLSSVMFLNSCSKNMQDVAATPAQDNSLLMREDPAGAQPIAWWTFDSTWKEREEHLVGVPHSGAKFSSPAQAEVGIAAFLSPNHGYVSYDNAGTALNNITSGLTVDFWVYAYPKEGGAQCIWCLPQTGAFWPDMHVLLDAYNSSQGDSALIKVMFKANKAIDYNEQWTQASGIPKFYKHWSHVKYSYNGSNSQYTLIVNNHTYFDHVVLYTSGDTTSRQPLGDLVANPNPHGFLVGTFQNIWDPTLFGDPQPWMLGFRGRVDQLKIYNTALF